MKLRMAWVTTKILPAHRVDSFKVDIPTTVSRHLGHQDAGSLKMKTYGCLRDEHCRCKAEKVSFQPGVL